MKEIILILLVSLFATSCGSKSESVKSFVYEELKDETFKKLVNDYNIENGGNQTIDKTIYSDEAKAYFSLYKDGKIVYEIPGVGEGEGTWNMDGKSIVLTADTGIFDMILYIKSKDNDNYEFHYRDRFGFNIVKASVKNVN